MLARPLKQLPATFPKMAFVVDWNRARRPSLVSLRLGLPSDRAQLAAHLQQVDEPTIWRLVAETGHAVAAGVGPPGTPDRLRTVQALMHSWECSAELFLMSTIERLRSKCRLLNACDAALFQGVQQAVSRWNLGPTLLALDGTEPVLAKLRALFTDLDGVFVIRRGPAETRLTVMLSEQIPPEAWRRYLSAAFEQPLDDDMVTDDVALAVVPSSPIYQFTQFSPKQAVSEPSSPLQKPIPVYAVPSPSTLLR